MARKGWLYSKAHWDLDYLNSLLASKKRLKELPVLAFDSKFTGMDFRYYQERSQERWGSFDRTHCMKTLRPLGVTSITKFPLAVRPRTNTTAYLRANDLAVVFPLSERISVKREPSGVEYP